MSADPTNRPVDVHDGPDAGERPAEAFGEAVDRLREAREYAAYYLSARGDAMRAKVRSTAIWAAIGAVGAVAGGALLATAMVLLVVGLADGINALLRVQDHTWPGQLIASGLLLGLIGGAGYVVMRRLRGQWFRRTVRKYEQRRTQQHERWGHDVHQRSVQRRDTSHEGP